MTKEKTKKDSKKEQNEYLKIIGQYIQKNYAILLLMLAGFITVSIVNFMKISTAQTVASFNLDDFEIGQIADRTIIANTTLSPDDSNKAYVVEGEKIIKKGFPITEEAMLKLKKMSASPLYIDYRKFANNELFLFLISICWLLLFSFLQPDKKRLFREPLLQVIFFIIVYISVVFFQKISYLSNPYAITIIIPASFFIMLVTVLYGQMPAVILSFIMSFGVLNATDYQLIPFIYTIGTSLCSVAIVRKIERRLDLVVASIILALYNVLLMIIMIVIFNENFITMGKCLIGVAINGFLSGILTLGFLTPLETLLNTASVFRLMDLSDLNSPLMRRMLIQASGTYNHSMMVAQLAEIAAREIGANALLARVGAYYHDIGKIEQPEYFVENQRGENKHDDINPTLSASVIKSHVKKGVEKAHQLHLPNQIIDIIAEHHGNSVIAFFYNEAKEKDSSLEPEYFAYPGNPPSSKESAIVMLADTVEAACRTLENPSVMRLEKFINQLVTGKMEHKQLSNCELTFREITQIKDAFLQVLAGHYHSRIEYPDQKDPDSKPEEKQIEKQNEKQIEKQIEKKETLKIENQKSESQTNEEKSENNTEIKSETKTDNSNDSETDTKTENNGEKDK